MSVLMFKSRQGEFTVDKCPIPLLEWYSKQADPKWAAHREAAIDELSRRSPEPEEANRSIEANYSDAQRRYAQEKPKTPAAIVKQEWKLASFVSKESEVLNDRLAIIQQTCHLITPTTIFGDLPAGYTAQVAIVAINKADDCVNIEGNLMLSAHTLKRVATAAGIHWDIANTKRTDDNSQRNYWSFQAVGNYIDVDGTERPLSGVYEFDVRDDSARVKQAYAAAIQKAAKSADEKLEQLGTQVKDPDLTWQGFYAQEVERYNVLAERDIEALRKNGLTRAETGAKSRAIAELIKRSERGSNAWAKPIACVRLIKQQSAQAATQKLYPSPDGEVIEGQFETDEGKTDAEG